MKFRYAISKPFGTSPREAFPHYLILQNTSELHTDGVGKKIYDNIVANVSQQLGSPFEVWAHFSHASISHDVEWIVTDLVPLAFGFRNKESAMIAKLLLGADT